VRSISTASTSVGALQIARMNPPAINQSESPQVSGVGGHAGGSVSYRRDSSCSPHREWQNPAGTASTRRDTSLEAYNWAIEAMAKGFQNVQILDEQGKSYSPSEFVKLSAGLKK
jgi:hypothetical protein